MKEMLKGCKLTLAPGVKAVVWGGVTPTRAHSHLSQNTDDNVLQNTCAQSISKPLKLLVYSTRDQSVRGV
jgi:hypothetical protein